MLTIEELIWIRDEVEAVLDDGVYTCNCGGDWNGKGCDGTCTSTTLAKVMDRLNLEIGVQKGVFKEG